MDLTVLDGTLRRLLPSRRERIATAILGGLVTVSKGPKNVCVDEAVELTDLLIQALNAKPKQEQEMPRPTEKRAISANECVETRKKKR
jgi:hypothetical protein